jgi:Coiled stalk of trimeric autotransporter adhesin
MPFNQNGIFTRLYSWVADSRNGIKIRADKMDDEFNEIAQGLSRTMLRDGSAKPTSDIDLNAKKITNLAAGTADSDAVNKLQLNAVVTSATAYQNSTAQALTQVSVAAQAEAAARSQGDNQLYNEINTLAATYQQDKTAQQASIAQIQAASQRTVLNSAGSSNSLGNNVLSSVTIPVGKGGEYWFSSELAINQSDQYTRGINFRSTIAGVTTTKGTALSVSYPCPIERTTINFSLLCVAGETVDIFATGNGTLQSFGLKAVQLTQT